MVNHIDNILLKTKKINSFFDSAFILIFGLIFIVAANFLVVSLGGNGLELPPNVAVWSFIAVLILLSFYKILLTDKFIQSKLLVPLLIMSLLLVLPGLVHAESDKREILLRIAQVVGFFLLFFSISQYQFSDKKINHILYLIVFSAFIQIIYAIAQKYHNPEITPAFLKLFLGVNKPPVGGFLQINSLSIFLVTAIVISLHLLCQKSFNKQLRIAKLLLLLVMLGGGFILATISSRAALFALGLSLPLMLFSQWESIKKQKFWSGILIMGLMVGVLAGFLMGNGINKLENRTTSPRSLAWSLSIDAIKEKPMLGHGLAGFAKAFFDQNEIKLRKSIDDKASAGIAFYTHPHNEILYWGVESGILAILGIFGFILYYLKLLFTNYRRRQALQYLALLLPITLSTQVSLPFYLSSLLMIMFIFLFLLPFNKLSTEKTLSLNELLKKALIIIFGVIFVFYLWFIKETIKGGITITRYVKIENSPLSMVQGTLKNPYWGKVATNYAHQYVMNALLQQGNKKEARKHLRWFEDQLAVEEAPMYFEVLLVSYPVFGEVDNYKRIREKMINRYPGIFNHFPAEPTEN